MSGEYYTDYYNAENSAGSSSSSHRGSDGDGCVWLIAGAVIIFLIALAAGFVSLIDKMMKSGDGAAALLLIILVVVIAVAAIIVVVRNYEPPPCRICGRTDCRRRR